MPLGQLRWSRNRRKSSEAKSATVAISGLTRNQHRRRPDNRCSFVRRRPSSNTRRIRIGLRRRQDERRNEENKLPSPKICQRFWIGIWKRGLGFFWKRERLGVYETLGFCAGFRAQVTVRNKKPEAVNRYHYHYHLLRFFAFRR
jgi:hypothetical protein